MTNFSKYSRRLLIAAGLVVSATGALAQSSATATGTATATIIRPITMTAPVHLAFGNVVPGASPGTLVLAATSGTPTPTVTGGVTQPGTQIGTVTAAEFDVAGEGGFTYTITLPTGAATISDSSSDVMTVDTWTSSIATTAGAGHLSGTAGNAGAQVFYVAGTLHVAANQAPANYTGTFSVTVAYN
jgi:Domain of unknown function (DUF4402)